MATPHSLISFGGGASKDVTYHSKESGEELLRKTVAGDIQQTRGGMFAVTLHQISLFLGF